MKRNFKNYIFQIKIHLQQKICGKLILNLVNYLAKGIHEIKCKYGHDDKICQTCMIKYKDFKCFFEYTNFIDDLIECKCLCCKKNYQKTFDKNLKNNF